MSCLWMRSTCFAAMVAVALSSLSYSQCSAAKPSSTADPLITALQAEMQRAKSQLKISGMQSPYYIEYSVLDSDSYNTDASFGAVTDEQRVRARALIVVVRVGDYKQDNSVGQAMGLVDLLPLEDDLYALRRAVWLATDRAYKQSLAMLAAKQSMLRRYQVEQPVDDFSHETATVSIGERVTLNMGTEHWPQLLQSLTSIYKKDPSLHSLNGSIKFTAVNRYLVNSEGTTTRQGQAVYRIALVATTQADDGMQLNRTYGDVEPTLQGLPAPAKLRSEAEQLLQSLAELRKAPVVKEDYDGPVLFSNESADLIVSELIAKNVAGIKPQLGANTRAAGDYSEKYKTRIMPDFVSIVDDPTIATFKGEGLISNYAVDDEGVKAVPLTVVENGTLVNFLMARQPIRDFPHSNGHGRFNFEEYGPAAIASPSTFQLKSSKTSSSAELKQKLLALCKEKDLPYGYYVEKMGPGFRQPSRGEREVNNAASGFNPILLYRVWVKDGHQELVRGAEFSGLDTRALRNQLLALGDDPFVEAGGSQESPASLISPSMLFGDLEVKSSEAGKDTLPQYPAPDLVAQ